MIHQLAVILALYSVAITIIAAICCHTAARQHTRGTQAKLDAHQHAANAAAQTKRAALLERALEQATDRNSLLVAHNNELEAENEALHERVLYLSGLIRAVDSEAITRMAVMDGPRVLLPREEINLN